MKKLQIYILMSLILLFIGCGGGGDTKKDPPLDTNHAPTITTSVFSIDENITTIGTIQANDSDGDTLSYSIVGGDDQNKFNLNNTTGVLKFNFDTNYSNPSDSNDDNIYKVEIKVSDTKLDVTKLISVNVNEYIINNASIITKLNNLRQKSGMISLKDNIYLNDSSLNHAKYLVELNRTGHYETNTSANNYTGYKPYNRALHTGYKSRKVSENLSVGQESEDLSLDGLMSAIYHRFGFLDFDIDEIGYAKQNKAYVYNMGNTYINTLCSEGNFTTPGTYYYGICEEDSFRIESSKYDDALNTIINRNPSYVIYPYLNQTDIAPVFFEESPDPLPSYGVSGYPISIEFNSNDFNMSNFTLDSFVLKDSNSNLIDLIDHNNSSNIMVKTNDPSGHFSDYQFAIFPNTRLDFNSTYSARVSYTYEGNYHDINWNFTTNVVPNLITYNDTNISMELDKEYYIYFEPTDSNDIISTYSIGYSYNGTDNVVITKSLYDKNTLKLKLSGSSIRSAKITLNGPSVTDKIINITIQ